MVRRAGGAAASLPEPYDRGRLLPYLHALAVLILDPLLPAGVREAVRLEGPGRSGILLLSVVSLVPGGFASGIALSTTGRYRPLHLAGYAFMAVGSGLLVRVDRDPPSPPSSSSRPYRTRGPD